MAETLLNRVLDARTAAIREFASCVRHAVAHDRLITPSDIRAAALTQMWGLTQIRSRISEEKNSLALAIKNKDVPADFALRIVRLSLAKYFIDIVVEMQKSSAILRTPTAIATFTSAIDAIRHILDQDYFSKSSYRIIEDYLDVEPVIVAASVSLSVPLKTLPDVVRDYKMRVAEEIDREIDRLNAKI